MPEVEGVVQYGALGVLALVILSMLQLFRLTLSHQNKAADRIDGSINRLAEAIKDAAAELKELVFTQRADHQEVLRKIEESAKETRHSIKSDVQLLNALRSAADREKDK